MPNYLAEIHNSEIIDDDISTEFTVIAELIELFYRLFGVKNGVNLNVDFTNSQSKSTRI